MFKEKFDQTKEHAMEFNKKFKDKFLMHVPFKKGLRPDKWSQVGGSILIAHSLVDSDVREYMDIRMKKPKGTYPGHKHAILLGMRQIHRDTHGVHHPHRVMAGCHMKQLRAKLIGANQSDDSDDEEVVSKKPMRDLSSDDPLQTLLATTDIGKASPETQEKITNALKEYVKGDITESHLLTEIEMVELNDEIQKDLSKMETAAHELSYEMLVSIYNKLNVEDAAYLVDHPAMWDMLLDGFYELIYAEMEQEMTLAMGSKIDKTLAAEVNGLPPIETVMTGVQPINPAADLEIIEEKEAAGESQSSDDIVTDLTEPSADPTNPRWARLKERKKRWKQSLNNLSKGLDEKSGKALGSIKKGNQTVLRAIRDNKGRIIMYLGKARDATMTPENKEHAKIVLNHLMKMTSRFTRNAGTKLRGLSGDVLTEAIKMAKVYAPEARDAAIRAVNKIFREAMEQVRQKGPDLAERAARAAAKAASSAGSKGASAGGGQIVSWAGKLIKGRIYGGEAERDGFELPPEYAPGIAALDELTLSFHRRASGLEICEFDGEIYPPDNQEWTFPPDLQVPDVLAVLEAVKNRTNYGLLLIHRMYLFAMNAPLMNPSLVEAIVEGMTRLREMEVCQTSHHKTTAKPIYIEWIANLSGSPYTMLPLRDVVSFWVDLIHALRCLFPECDRFFDTKFSWHPSISIDVAREVKTCLLKNASR